MDFDFDDDQLDLRSNARAVLADACPPSLVRAVVEGTDTPERLWKRLVDLGWPALGIAEEHGGLGLSFIEVGIVVEELGRAVASTPFLATATQFVPFIREVGRADHRERFLPAVAQGEATGACAVAESNTWRLDAVQATARRRGDTWVLEGSKDHVLDGATATELVVVARAPGSSGLDGLGVFVVPGLAATVEPHRSIDPTTPLTTLVLDGIEVGPERVLAEPGDPAALPAIERALQEATAAMALSATATCRVIFEWTLQYAKDRVQFDRPIGSFQAIKHRMADLYLTLERATAVGYLAALTIAEDDDRRATAVPMAKAAASDCVRLLVKDGLQLHGGIGFTWEYDLHLWLKRAKAADALFGSGLSHRAVLVPLLGLAP